MPTPPDKKKASPDGSSAAQRKTPDKPEQADREARLAEALRENLRRRKRPPGAAETIKD
ncbi:MAG: hypothetical protein AAFW81_03825 [Pseudomonadota bacterium]